MPDVAGLVGLIDDGGGSRGMATAGMGPGSSRGVRGCCDGKRYGNSGNGAPLNSRSHGTRNSGLPTGVRRNRARSSIGWACCAIADKGGGFSDIDAEACADIEASRAKLLRKQNMQHLNSLKGPFALTPGPFELTQGPFEPTPGPFALTPGPFERTQGPVELTPGQFELTQGPFELTPSNV